MNGKEFQSDSLHSESQLDEKCYRSTKAISLLKHNIRVPPKNASKKSISELFYPNKLKSSHIRNNTILPESSTPIAESEHTEILKLNKG